MTSSRWHAHGNAYLVVEDEKYAIDDRLDGAIEVLSVEGDDMTIAIVNPDGSHAEMSGNGTRIAGAWLMDRTGMNISKFDLVASGIAAALVAVLAVFFSKTRTGRALRAVADDHQAALAVGISLRKIWVIVWIVAGFVALVTGLLWGARNGVQFALTFLALKALPVLILGGFESIAGAIVGGLIVGASEKLAEVYIGPYVGGGIESWFPYVLALAFLLVRPEGLFGERRIDRV